QKKCRVAVIQAAPVFFNKEKTIDKVCTLIKKAAQGGAQLVVFPSHTSLVILAVCLLAQSQASVLKKDEKTGNACTTTL
ncbi:MAG: hypothetical protein IJU32_08085, partial [Pyramidobacter sp.]|nr:hypothetical protein [Pyramidobacter sp.]